MKFIVLDSEESPYPTDEATIFLVKDNWNDWWEYRTLYVIYFSRGKSIDWIGTIKIGQKGLRWSEGSSLRPNIPSGVLDKLDSDFFSLGQDVTYYNNLNQLGAEIRFQVLSGLNDIAFDEELYEEIKNEHITNRSLLRSVSITSVKGQYRRLANGNAELTDYFFSYTLPNSENPKSFEVEVKPKSIPPSNLQPKHPANNPFPYGIKRSIFRPLQYAAGEMDIQDIRYGSRYVVQYAGMHLEATTRFYLIVNQKLGKLRNFNSTLGKVVHQLDKLQLLDKKTAECLYIFIKLYNKSKHEVNQDRTRERLFSVSDALVVYLAVRILGNRIIQEINPKELESSVEI